MSLYLPKGNFQNEVIDPKKLEEEWIEARRIAESADSWQFLCGDSDSLTYSNLAENSAGVKIHQKRKTSFIQAGYNLSQDGPNLQTRYLGNAPEGYVPWQIPPMKGQNPIWDGGLTLSWESSDTEMVLMGYSMWVYRLSSGLEALASSPAGAYFDDDVQIRIKTGLRLDGSLIEGSGPGTNIPTNGPEFAFGSGLSQKGFTATSDSIQMLRAGHHTVTPTAGQGPSMTRSRDEYYKTNVMKYNDKVKHGVAVVNARVFAIRFPSGKLFGQ